MKELVSRYDIFIKVLVKRYALTIQGLIKRYAFTSRTSQRTLRYPLKNLSTDMKSRLKNK